MSGPATEVLILGGSGFIGRQLSKRLRVASTADGVTPRPRVTPLSSSACDLLDLPSARRCLAQSGPQTTLVICAGISRLAGDSWSLFQRNLTMVRNLLESLPADHVRSIVFLSSTDVYGLPAVELPICESTPVRPTTYYGLSKLACEQLFSIGNQVRCPVACLRLPGIYGPTDGGKSVVGRFCRRLASGHSLELSGEGKVLRDLIHVDDLCALIDALVTSPREITLNVATGRSRPIREIVELVADQLQLSSARRSELIEFKPPNPARDHPLVFETNRLQAAFPEVRFRQIASGIADYLQHVEEES